LLCLLIFGGEYGYAQVDLSGGRHSHGGGMGWLKADDGSGRTHLTVTVEYHESESGCQRRSESSIPLSRLIILPTPFAQMPSRRAVDQSHNQPKNSSVEVQSLPNAP
jgi:hypothetical protein